MATPEKPGAPFDWTLATWDGARREALRRWAKLPLERVIAAQEEMAELSQLLAGTPSRDATATRDRGSHNSDEQAEAEE